MQALARPLRALTVTAVSVALVGSMAIAAGAHSRVVSDPVGDQRGSTYFDITAAATDDTHRFVWAVKLRHRARHAVTRYSGVGLRIDSYGDRGWDYFAYVLRSGGRLQCMLFSRRRSLGRGGALIQRKIAGCYFAKSRIYLGRRGFAWNTFTFSGNSVADYTRRSFHPKV